MNYSKMVRSNKVVFLTTLVQSIIIWDMMYCNKFYRAVCLFLAAGHSDTQFKWLSVCLVAGGTESMCACVCTQKEEGSRMVHGTVFCVLIFSSQDSGGDSCLNTEFFMSWK